MPPDENHSFEAGLREGEVRALANMLEKHEIRFEKQSRRFAEHENRLRWLERMHWITLGIIIAIQFLPELRNLLATSASG